MLRFVRPQTIGVLLVLVGISSRTSAQELATTPKDAIAAQVSVAQAVTAPSVTVSAPRPAALVPLYASFVTLQVIDLHSTAYALDRGAVESNPAMQGFVDNRFAMAAVKAAGTAGVIFVSEKLRTKNKAAALGLMIASNVAMTWVVQHNYRAVR